MTFWHKGKFVFHPKREYGNGKTMMMFMRRSLISWQKMVKIINKLGQENYKIWFVGNINRFGEEGFLAESEAEFDRVFDLAVNRNYVNVIVQHCCNDEIEEEKKSISNRKRSSLSRPQEQKGKVCLSLLIFNIGDTIYVHLLLGLFYKMLKLYTKIFSRKLHCINVVRASQKKGKVQQRLVQ